MKKIITLLLTLIVITLACVGCGDTNEQKPIETPKPINPFDEVKKVIMENPDAISDGYYTKKFSAEELKIKFSESDEYYENLSFGLSCSITGQSMLLYLLRDFEVG